MISNIEKIDNEELRNNIRQIRSDVIDLIQSEEHISTKKEIVSKVNKLLNGYVMGVGKAGKSIPISICDHGIYIMDDRDGYKISLLVNYQITWGYKPYQELDKSIQLDFDVTQSEIRNEKIFKILNK